LNRFSIFSSSNSKEALGYAFHAPCAHAFLKKASCRNTKNVLEQTAPYGLPINKTNGIYKDGAAFGIEKKSRESSELPALQRGQVSPSTEHHSRCSRLQRTRLHREIAGMYAKCDLL
jgi:hypothetical protein